MNLEHLHLHVRDRSLAEQFYCTWFGMRIARRGQHLTFLTDDGGFDLAISQDPAPGAFPGWFHFGFRLESAQAVTDLHDRMASGGVRIPKPMYADDTMVSFRCADPDGYPIEIYWEVAGAPLD
jgi:catechol 2,3-dioxygenase-like lactoylglutathione lyase family enzyme